MNRRTAIRHAVLLAAGAALLPSCTHGDKTASIPLKNLSLTGAEEDMLAALGDAIIPKTNGFTGASDLRSHEFVLTMVDDCHSIEDQQQFSRGMKQFEEACKKKWNASFAACTPGQKKELLQNAEKKQEMPEDALKFYETTKRYTLQSFTSSKDFMTQIRDYKMVSGPNFRGCVAIKG
jgi:hypothetical protein